MTSARRTANRSPAGRSPRDGRNRVRIVGGRWRSRLVHFPPGAELRPTPDRVRETLFNWLGQRLDGLACLDLFAGSGALGFEALSRGAAKVVMVEQDRVVAAALRASARALEAQGARIVEGEALAFLRAAADERFDIAFVDPPYASRLAVPVLAQLVAHMNPGARVYVESAEPIAPPAPWMPYREARAGAVRYALFELADPGASPEREPR